MKKAISLVVIMTLISSCGHYRSKKSSTKNFDVMDKNKDGAVSLVEWSNYYNKKFKKKDMNEDGILTKDEIKKKKMRKKKM